MVLPPSKRRKAPKKAWTLSPSFFSIPPSATSCTHLPLQGRQKGLFNFDEARFSHFIDSLKPVSLMLAGFFTLIYIIVLNNILYIIIYNIEIRGKQTVFRLFIEQIYCFSA